MSTAASNRHARGSDDDTPAPEVASVLLAIQSSTERLIRVVRHLPAEHRSDPLFPTTPSSDETDISWSSTPSTASSASTGSSSPIPSPSPHTPSPAVPESRSISPDSPSTLEPTNQPSRSAPSTLSDLLASSGPKRKRSITHFQGIPISMLPPPMSPPQCNATEPPKRVTTKTHAHVGGRKVVVLRRVMDLDHALERLDLNHKGGTASLNPRQGAVSVYLDPVQYRSDRAVFAGCWPC
jgi:hypothetical protein